MVSTYAAAWDLNHWSIHDLWNPCPVKVSRLILHVKTVQSGLTAFRNYSYLNIVEVVECFEQAFKANRALDLATGPRHLEKWALAIKSCTTISASTSTVDSNDMVTDKGYESVICVWCIESEEGR